MLNCCWNMKTNNGFSKFISMKTFDYKYHQTVVIIRLEIIYLHCLGIMLFILLFFACESTIFILGVGLFCSCILSPATSSPEQFFFKKTFFRLHLTAKWCDGDHVAQLWSRDPEIIILIWCKFYSRWRDLGWVSQIIDKKADFW